MSIVDHDGSAEFPCPKEHVFEAILQAVSGLPGMKVDSAERLSGRIVVKAGISAMSWGENIPISVTESGPGKTRVAITSTPKTGVLFGGLFDFGKNRGNLEKIFSATAEVLTGRPTGSSVPTPSPTSWVLCGKCGGGNYPGAAYCQWCGAPVAAQLATSPTESAPPPAPPAAAPPGPEAAAPVTLLATFGPSTGWVGKTITRQGDAFILEGHGPISAAAIMEYDRQGHLTWTSPGARALVGSQARVEPETP